MLPDNTIYIKIYENRVHVRSIDDRKEIELSAETPFTTERLLVGTFTVAKTLFTKGVKIVLGRKCFALTVLMHPMEKIDGGLSQVEDRVLKDLALSLGAQKVVVWIGHELSDNEVKQKVKQEQ
jgi:hypothetical protein